MAESTLSARPLPPGSMLGVMGGGQLGRMFAHAAQSMGYGTCVLDPDATSPAGLVSHKHIRTAYTDPQGLAEMASSCMAVTTEFENVPAEALQVLARSLPVAPGASAVSVAQDRMAEKRFFVDCVRHSGVGPAPHAGIETAADLSSVTDDLLPGILKTARMGYDGKGQVRVRTRNELAHAWAQLRQVPCVLEKMLPLQSECSLVIARNAQGQVVSLPMQVNIHRDGILAVTEVFEGAVPAALVTQAREAARAIAEGLGYVGVLCVEFFIVQGAQGPQLVVNEIAPRPHNSGHHSIDACDVSQFELQVRTMAHLPLAPPRQHSAAVMLNLLGDLWFAQSEQAVEPAWDQILALPGTHLHLYGKTDARRARKMGHLTITAADIGQARQTALQAARILGIEPWL